MGQQEITLYYDSEKKIPKETFLISEKNSNHLHGSYTAYYKSGRIRVKGNYEHNVASGWWEYFYENGKPKMRGNLRNNVNHGLWEYFYENGSLEMKGEVYDTIRQGHWKFYYEKGSLKREGNFLDGKKEGLWEYFDEDGKLKSEEVFKGDLSAYKEYYASGELKLKGNRVKGQSEGIWTQYYKNGHIKAVGNYHQGNRQGKWRFYHENGKLASTGDFLEGFTVGKWTYYHENGNISAEGAEKDGLKEGYWKLYYSNGDFKGEAVFNQGEGIYQEFYKDSTLKVKGFLSDGAHQGKWQYFYEDGMLEGEAVFKNGKGTYYGYYRNGVRKMQGTIENGERTGLWQLYKPDGQLAGYYTSVYENNEPVFKALSNSEAALSAEDAKDTSLNPEYMYRKKAVRYFKQRVNEFQGIIAGVNPVGLILNRLSFNVEYYMQERLGYELEIGAERSPFFMGGRDMEANTAYYRGFFLGIKQKFYHTDTRSGMFYFGHRLGFDDLNHYANVAEVHAASGSLISKPVSKIIAEEQRISYTMVGGTRLMKDSDVINTRVSRETDSPGLTFDLFAGFGVGYRFFRKSSTEENYNSILKKVPQSRLLFPLQLGATVGYVF